VYFGRFIEKVIESVTSGTRYYDHFALLVEFEELPVDAGIFPTSVVDKSATVDFVEKVVVASVDERFYATAAEHIYVYRHHVTSVFHIR
jgi:hypothetical protein